MNKKIFILAVCLGALTGTSPATAADDFYADFLKKTDRQYEKILVKRVVRADKIVLENDERIRLIGIKAPDRPKAEKAKPNQYGFVVEEINPLDTIEERAFAFAKDLLEGKYVRVEFDTRKTNEDFETLAYVFLADDNTLANARIVSQGFAKLALRPPNTKYAELLRTAYREARREKRGLQSD